MAIPPFPGTEAFGQPQQEERVPSVGGDVGGGPAHLGTPPGRGGQNPFTPPASPAVLRGGPADLLATPERRPGTSRGAWLCGNAERRVDEAERRAEQLRSGAKEALLASEAERKQLGQRVARLEAELQDARREIAALREKESEGGGGVRFRPAQSWIDDALAGIRSAGPGVVVRLMCYTFDEPRIAEELCTAAARGAEVKVCMDVGELGRASTGRQPLRAYELSRAGAVIRLCSGRALAAVYGERTWCAGRSGVQHCKVLCLGGERAWIGSHNITLSALSNVECMVEVGPREVTCLRDLWAFFEQVFEAGVSYEPPAEAPEIRVRLTSKGRRAPKAGGGR